MLLIIHMEDVWWVPLILYHEGYIWTGHGAVLSFILNRSIFIHFVHHDNTFYDKCIKNDNRTKYVDGDGSGVKKNRS